MMCLKEISLNEFADLFPDNPCKEGVVYNGASFNKLNASKAEAVRPVVGYVDGHAVAGQIFGIRDGVARAPFSAPFSSLSTSHDLSVNEFYDQVRCFLNMPLRLVWPPDFYPVPPAPDSYKRICEFNYHYPLQRFADYEKYLSRSGRYNHHRALKHNFEFIKTDNIGRVYSVIAENSRLMGYPLAMSLADVEATVRIIPADFFLLTLDGADVAAAMIYHVSPGIVQVIYWGDLPFGRFARSMNSLAWHIFGWYAAHCPDIKIIDIGPASTDGVRNEGLCQFKLSLGCIETLRPTIYI